MSWAHLLGSRLAEQDAPSWLNPALLTFVGTVLTAVLAGVGAWLVRRQGKKVDEASVRKTAAETTSIEVATARALIEEVRGMLDSQRAHYERLMAGMQGELKGLTERVASNEEQQRVLRSAFSAHKTWDDDATAALRTFQPDWPEPPRIDLND